MDDLHRLQFLGLPLIELASKKMGIVGYGAIGKAVGKIAKAMNMEILPFRLRLIRKTLIGLPWKRSIRKATSSASIFPY